MIMGVDLDTAILSDIPVKTCAIRYIFIFTPAYIENRRTVLKFLL